MYLCLLRGVVAEQERLGCDSGPYECKQVEAHMEAE